MRAAPKKLITLFIASPKNNVRDSSVETSSDQKTGNARDYTSQLWYRSSFQWPNIDVVCIRKSINALQYAWVALQAIFKGKQTGLAAVFKIINLYGA